MTTDPIKALVDLGPEIKRRVKLIDEGVMVNGRNTEATQSQILHAVLAAIEALTPIAEGTQNCGCKAAWKQGFCYGDPEYYPPPSASTGKDGVVERVARAICRENCAFVGEKPCFEVEGAWPNPNCQEPGCHSQARAALAAINGEQT